MVTGNPHFNQKAPPKTPTNGEILETPLLNSTTSVHDTLPGFILLLLGTSLLPKGLCIPICFVSYIFILTLHPTNSYAPYRNQLNIIFS